MQKYFRRHDIDDITTKGRGFKSLNRQCRASLHMKTGRGRPIPDDLLPYACVEEIRSALIIAAARGTEALAALWCRLSPFQKHWLDPQEFPAFWAAAELADVRWRPEIQGHDINDLTAKGTSKP
jgi:hypothetical protein